MKQFPLTPVEEEGWLCDSRQAVAAQLRANLGNVLFAVAYNEFCAPTLEESVEELIKKGQPTLPSPRRCLRRAVLTRRSRFLKSSIICGRSIRG